jgi:hypothetical protein
MDKRDRKPQPRKTRECAGCGEIIVIDPKRNFSAKFCSHACYAKKQKGRNGGHLKRKCAACHAAMGMTGAASGRLIGISKAHIARIRKEDGLRRLNNREARVREQIQAHGIIPWWGGVNEGQAWMSGYNPRFPDWSSLWFNEKNKEKNKEKARDYYKSKYGAMTTEEKRKMFLRMRELKIQKHGIAQYRKTQREILARWKAKNPEKAKESTRKALAKMRKNPMHRVAFNMRGRFKEIMKGVKTLPTQGRWELIGCSQSELRRHLELQFKGGMTWANYGTKWHVDHILPCASFDHTDPRQVAQCWHWTNLRPMEAKKNIAKGARITEPQLSLLLCATY